MTTTVKAFRCVLDHCPTPERVYGHEAHFVKHLISRAHRLGKRQARKIVKAQATSALVVDGGALALRAHERVTTVEQRVRDRLAQINRLREEVEADIDVEQRRQDSRSRFLSKARRFLDAL